MELYIDDNQVAIEDMARQTLESVLRHAQENLCPPGRMVVGIRHEGKEIPAAELAGTLQEQASTFSRLDLITSTRDVVVVDAMDQASVALTQTEEACRRVADGLAEGKVAESMQALGDCLSVWQQIHEAITKSTQMMELDCETTLVNGEPLVEYANKPMGVLLRVKEALQAQDHVLLADTLKYEFSEVADQWRDVIARIQAEADTSDDA